MPRFKMCSVAAVAAMAMGATSAHAENTVKLTIGATPAKKSASAKKLRNVAIRVTVDTATTDGTQPVPATNAVISFAKGFAHNAGKFPTCDPAALKSKGVSGCPAGANIGSGSAEIKAGTLTPSGPVTSKLTVFNAKPQGGKPAIVILSQVTNPIRDTRILVGTLSEASGQYGIKLDMPIPPINPIAGQAISITKLDLTVKGQTKVAGKAVNFIDAPLQCAGTWAFKGDFVFQGGQQASSESVVKCS